jgi:hypothetical protein
MFFDGVGGFEDRKVKVKLKLQLNSPHQQLISLASHFMSE